jgi:hypothetical protein
MGAGTLLAAGKRSSIMGDDHHAFRLQLGGRICLLTVRALAGFLCDVDGLNAVASQLRSHRFDAPVQNSRAPGRVAGNLGPSIDVDERDRLRRGAGGGVNDHLPADHGQGRPAPGRLIKIVALDLRRRGASGERYKRQPARCEAYYSAISHLIGRFISKDLAERRNNACRSVDSLAQTLERLVIGNLIPSGSRRFKRSISAFCTFFNLIVEAPSSTERSLTSLRKASSSASAPGGYFLRNAPYPKQSKPLEVSYISVSPRALCSPAKIRKLGGSASDNHLLLIISCKF